MRKILIATVLFTGMSASTSLTAHELPKPVPYCEGNACDLYLPLAKPTINFKDNRAKKRLSAVLGGLTGAVLGEDIAGVPGAIGFGLLGAVTGYDHEVDDRYLEDYRALRASEERGDDIYFNPVHRLPPNAHYRVTDKRAGKKNK